MNIQPPLLQNARRESEPLDIEALKAKTRRSGNHEFIDSLRVIHGARDYPNLFDAT